jgi:plasmid stabilization system protein ParE
MMRIEWSPRSVADLASIRAFIAADSARYADLTIHRLIRAADQLSSFPRMGRIVPEVGEPDLRELIVPPFRIVYRVRPSLVEVVLVFRSSRVIPEDVGSRS